MKNYEDMTPQEQEEYMKAMTEADRIWNDWKVNGKPKTSKQICLEYEQNHRLV
jgi:hypothetical protein